MSSIHRWFWVEALSAVLAGGLAILTVSWHAWIEAVFRIDPDHASGSAEVCVVAVLLAVALSAGLAARRTWMARRV